MSMAHIYQVAGNQQQLLGHWWLTARPMPNEIGKLASAELICCIIIDGQLKSGLCVCQTGLRAIVHNSGGRRHELHRRSYTEGAFSSNHAFVKDNFYFLQNADI
jgi:hypothetical protein